MRKLLVRWSPGLVCWAALLLGLLASAPVQAQPGTPALLPSEPAPAAVAVPGAAPGRTMVADVLMSGNRNVPTPTIMAQIKTRANTEYSPATVQDDVRNLMATKQFANVYQEITNLPDGRVTVKFVIQDYPTVVQRVIYQGAKHLKDDELEQLTHIRPGLPCSPVHNKLGCQAIVNKLNEDGRLFAQCELLSGDKVGDTEVVFNITEGPKVAIADIDFVGNTFVSGGVLRQHINSSRKFLHLFGGTYNAAMADNDSLKLKEYYRSFGYLDVQVSRELQWHPNGRDVILVFHIQEGQRYQVASPPQIHAKGNLTVPPEKLEALMKVKANEYFNQAYVESDMQRFKDAEGYEGHELMAKWTPVYSADTPGWVTLDYELEEKPQARVGQIFVVGNTRTMQNVILRQVPLYPGQILTYPDVRMAERNLARQNIFKTSPDGAVRPTVTVLDNPNNPNSEFKDILVTVEEDNTGSLQFGIGVNSDSGLQGTIMLTERNFDILRPPTSIEDLLSGNAWRGAGQEFRMEAVPGTQVQRYSISFREPYLFDTQFGFTTQGYYYERSYNEYTEERVGGKFQIDRRLGDYWRVSGGLRVENINVSNVPQGAPVDITSVEGWNFLYALRAGVSRDTRDSALRPTQGNLIDLSFEQAFGDFTFPVVNAEFNQYFPTFSRADGSGKQVIALRSQVGWAGSDTPVFERFYAGGYRSMRGFAFRGVSPSINGFMVGGDFMLLNSIEYQVPLLANDQVWMVGFVDSGTVESTVEIKNYRVSAGFGFRFVVPALGPLPIAIDFGFPIVMAPGDQRQIFQFFMGFAR
jgi:outer membrane protein assembly complex protein YaeT